MAHWRQSSQLLIGSVLGPACVRCSCVRVQVAVAQSRLCCALVLLCAQSGRHPVQVSRQAVAGRAAGLGACRPLWLAAHTGRGALPHSTGQCALDRCIQVRPCLFGSLHVVSPQSQQRPKHQILARRQSPVCAPRHVCGGQVAGVLHTNQALMAVCCCRLVAAGFLHPSWPRRPMSRFR
jgi:hypothetical protein